MAGLQPEHDAILNKAFVLFLLIISIFNNSRLIVAEMSEQRCDTIGWINLQLVLAVAISLYQPQFEIAVLYLFLIFVISAHVHYGVCVVRQMCNHFKVQCFTVPKEKRK